MPSAKFTPRVVKANRRSETDRDIRIAHHGWFYSWKLEANLPYRGLLSCDFLALAEIHPDVLQISSQPRALEWWNGREWLSYRPRYSLTLKTGSRGVSRSIDIEVLPSTDLKQQQTKYCRLKAEFREQARALLVLTERQIRVQPRLTNAEFILSQAGAGIVGEADKALIRQIAFGTKYFSLNEVVGLGVLPYPRAYSAVLNMVASGELAFALGRRFDGDTPVSMRRWQ